MIKSDSQTLGRRIRTAREAAKITQLSLAQTLGVSRVTVTQWEGDTTRPTPERFPVLASVLGVTSDWLLGGEHGQKRNNIPQERANFLTLPNATLKGKITSSPTLIPVLGQAVGGVNGEFEMNGNVLFEIVAPPDLAEIPGAYGVQIVGDSMSPRYDDGEICLVDPTRRPKKGDYVVAQIQADEHGPIMAFVKKFISHNSLELVVEQFNPPQLLRFPHASVVSVHFIRWGGPI